MKPSSKPINNPFLDRRCRLIPCQKERMFQMHHQEGWKLAHLEKLFKVSKGTASRICYPERRKEIMKSVNWKEYRLKLKHKIANREHRKYKRLLLNIAKQPTNHEQTHI